MLNLFNSNIADQTVSPTQMVGVRDRIAESLVGKRVTLRLGMNRVTKGIVRAVLHHADVPKLVVGLREFDLTQVLTSAPTFLKS
jgi:hypothetical protein